MFLWKNTVFDIMTAMCRVGNLLIYNVYGHTVYILLTQRFPFDHLSPMMLPEQ